MNMSNILRLMPTSILSLVLSLLTCFFLVFITFKLTEFTICKTYTHSSLKNFPEVVTSTTVYPRCSVEDGLAVFIALFLYPILFHVYFKTLYKPNK